MSELLCECCPMTVDQALEYVESGRPGRRQSHAAYKLAKELRRLRAVYERIAEIPAIGLSCGEPTIARQHVLRAISGEKHLPWMEDYAMVCKERDRLRAAVEKLGDKDRTFHVAYGNDHWVKVSDVLAALEGK